MKILTASPHIFPPDNHSRMCQIDTAIPGRIRYFNKTKLSIVLL